VLLLVFPHRHRTTVTNPALDAGLWGIKRAAAPAAPRHMPPVAGTPHRTHGPTTVAVVVAVRAARRRHHNPPALGVDKVADIVVREVIAPRFGHRDFAPEPTDRPIGSGQESVCCSNVAPMTDTETSKALQDFRRSIFGNDGYGEVMPDAYLLHLKRLTADADAVLATHRSAIARTAFWVKGRVLGRLACEGANDSDAEITGWTLRLDRIDRIKIGVKIERDPCDDEQYISGRALELNGNVVIKTEPRSGPRRLAEVEAFIDAVIAASSAI
jgi:hypothetical protein